MWTGTNAAVDRVLNALSTRADSNVIEESSGQWSARCPAHDDRKASLAIAVGDDGGAVLHCNAGCDIKAVVAALGLGFSDLMPGDRNGTRRKKGRHREIVAAYDYRDEAGTLLFQ